MQVDEQELVWYRCEDCGCRFSARRYDRTNKNHCHDCLERKAEERLRKRKFRKDMEGSSAFRLVYDPSGTFPANSVFGVLDIYYTLKHGYFPQGAKFVYNKDKRVYQVKGFELVGTDCVFRPNNRGDLLFCKLMEDVK